MNTEEVSSNSSSYDSDSDSEIEALENEGGYLEFNEYGDLVEVLPDGTQKIAFGGAKEDNIQNTCARPAYSHTEDIQPGRFTPPPKKDGGDIQPGRFTPPPKQDGAHIEPSRFTPPPKQDGKKAETSGSLKNYLPSDGKVTPLPKEDGQKTEGPQGPRILNFKIRKNSNGKFGIQVRRVGKEFYVAFVAKTSPASLAGLCFADKITDIEGVAYRDTSSSKLMKLLSTYPVLTISVTRPNCIIPLQAIVLSENEVILKTVTGVFYRKTTISKIATSAIVNMMRVISVNGQCIIGYSSSDLNIQHHFQIGYTTRIEVMPNILYKNLIKHQDKKRMKTDLHYIEHR